MRIRCNTCGYEHIIDASTPAVQFPTNCPNCRKVTMHKTVFPGESGFPDYYAGKIPKGYYVDHVEREASGALHVYLRPKIRKMHIEAKVVLADEEPG